MRLTIAFLLYIVILPANAKTLEVVVGLAKPPYVLSDGNSGFEIELIRHILRKAGHKANFVLVPFGRTVSMLSRNDVDAIMTVNKSTIPDVKLLTEAYIYYRNVAISRAEDNLEINDIYDLSNYTVSSFQNAHKILGPEFASAMQNSPLYVQNARQEVQPDLLIKGKVNFVVMDENIFNHYVSANTTSKQKSAFDYHRIFPKSYYQLAIKDEAIRKAFNRELNLVKNSEFYTNLLNKYQLSQ